MEPTPNAPEPTAVRRALAELSTALTASVYPFTAELTDTVIQQLAYNAANTILSEFSADELTLYLRGELSDDDFFYSDSSSVAEAYEEMHLSDWVALLDNAMDSQMTTLTTLAQALQSIAAPTEEPTPTEPPEGTQPFTVDLTYTATYGDEITVYAKDEDEALELARSNCPKPSADDLASNCECDFEIREED